MKKNSVRVRFMIFGVLLLCTACAREDEKSCSKLKDQSSHELIDEIKKEALSSASGDQYLDVLKKHSVWALAANQRIGACMGLAIANNSPESEIQSWRKTNTAVSWIVVSAGALSAKTDRVGWQSSRESFIKFIDAIDVKSP